MAKIYEFPKVAKQNIDRLATITELAYASKKLPDINNTSSQYVIIPIPPVELRKDPRHIPNPVDINTRCLEFKKQLVVSNSKKLHTWTFVGTVLIANGDITFNHVKGE